MTEYVTGFLTGVMIYVRTPLFYGLIGFGVLRMIYRFNRSAIKGVIGEWKVNRRLAALGDGYRVFTDLYVPNGEGGYTQVDHIVTSPKGIFVIETKHYSGWIFGNDRQKNWTQVIYKRKENLYNPIWQNFGHIQSLRGYLNNENLDMHSVIVFSSDATFKFNHPFETAHVIHLNELVKVIEQYEDLVLSEGALKGIHHLLEQLTFTDKQEKQRVKRAHLQSVKSEQALQKKPGASQSKAKVTSIKNTGAKSTPMVKGRTSATVETKVTPLGNCPRCASELVQRKGKFGEFVGCNAYPKCRYTLNREA